MQEQAFEPVCLSVEELPTICLNWMVAEGEGLRPRLVRDRWYPYTAELRDAANKRTFVGGAWNPVGGSGAHIAERERIGAEYQYTGPHKGKWLAQKRVEYGGVYVVGAEQAGDTEMEAKMRCYVQYRYGAKVWVPGELLKP